MQMWEIWCDKHHCNTPSIWALWQDSILSSVQTHENTLRICKKKHLKDPQTVRNNIVWSEEPEEWSIIPKVKCAGSSLILRGCFSAAGTEGLIWVEEKLNAPKYRDSLNTNPLQSLQIFRLGRKFTFQQDNGPKHTARVTYRQLSECPWVTQPQPCLEPNPIFLEKPENMRLPPSKLTELETWRGEEKNGR